MPKRPRAMYSKRVVRPRRAKTSALAKLSKQVSKIAEISSVPLKLRWYRDEAFVDRTPLVEADSGKLTVYMCPMPVAPNQVADSAPADFGDTGPVATAAGNFRKSKIWVTATDVNQKPRCTHRGGYLTYQLTRTNLSLRYYKVMLIRAKTVVADQLSLQRQFQYFDTAATPPIVAGQSSRLVIGYDYIHNPNQGASEPITGIQMNPQMWDVLHSETFKFGTNKPLAGFGAAPTTIGTKLRTDATGFIKLPAGGAVHKIWSSDHTQQATNLNYANQRSEKNVFLVIFAQKGSTTVDADTQPLPDTPAGELKLTMQVRDNYSCSEGSLTPQTGGRNGRYGTNRRNILVSRRGRRRYAV